MIDNYGYTSTDENANACVVMDWCCEHDEDKDEDDENEVTSLVMTSFKLKINNYSD